MEMQFVKYCENPVFVFLMTLYLIAFAHNHIVHIYRIDTQLLKSKQTVQTCNIIICRFP